MTVFMFAELSGITNVDMDEMDDAWSSTDSRFKPSTPGDSPCPG